MDSIQIHLRIGRYSWGLQTSYTSQLTYHNVYVIYCFIVRSRIFWQTWAILLLGCFFLTILKLRKELETLLAQITLQCHWDKKKRSNRRRRIRKGENTTSTDRLYLPATVYRCVYIYKYNQIYIYIQIYIYTYTYLSIYNVYICVQYGLRLLNIYDLHVRTLGDITRWVYGG